VCRKIFIQDRSCSWGLFVRRTSFNSLIFHAIARRPSAISASTGKHKWSRRSANAANNLGALERRVRPVTAVGQTAAGNALVEYFRSSARTSPDCPSKRWTTPTNALCLRVGNTPSVSRFLLVDRIRKLRCRKLHAKACNNFIVLRFVVRGCAGRFRTTFWYRSSAVSQFRGEETKRGMVVTLDARYQSCVRQSGTITSAHR